MEFAPAILGPGMSELTLRLSPPADRDASEIEPTTIRVYALAANGEPLTDERLSPAGDRPIEVDEENLVVKVSRAEVDPWFADAEERDVVATGLFTDGIRWSARGRLLRR